MIHSRTPSTCYRPNTAGCSCTLYHNSFIRTSAYGFYGDLTGSREDIKEIRLRNSDEEFSPNTLIIMCDEATGKEPLRKAVKEYGAEIIYDYTIINGMAIRIRDGVKIEEAIEYFKKVKGVVSVNRDRINHLVEPVKPRLETM